MLTKSLTVNIDSTSTLRIIVSIVTCCFTFLCSAQTTLEWDEFIESLYEEYIEEYDETDSPEDLTSEQFIEQHEETIHSLYELHLSPVNLNDLAPDTMREASIRAYEVAMEQLKSLPFLSGNQVIAIAYYVSTNYPMQSLGELMLIRELDYRTRLRLPLFCYVGESRHTKPNLSLSNLFKYSRHEFIARTDLPFYIKEGYKAKSKEVLAKNPNKVYQGNNNYHSLRYQLTSMNRLTAGFQIEKDAGETELDYLSAYVMMTKLGAVQTLILGDFKASFGLGLTVNHDLGFGKLSSISSLSGTYSMAQLNRGFTKHSSLSETNHFRGVATRIRLNPDTHLSAFVSYQHIDGTMGPDQTLSSVKTDGLHRTILEKSKKGIEHELTLGGNLSYYHKGWNLAATALSTHLSIPLNPRYDTPSGYYRQFYPQGDCFTNVSVTYGYTGGRFMFRGETAMSWSNGSNKLVGISSESQQATSATVALLPSDITLYKHPNNGLATLQSLRYRLGGNATLVSFLRYYETQYATLHGRSFGENVRLQNEMGLFVGMNAEPLQRIHLETYVDVFRFPERRNRASGASNGFEGVCKVSYTPLGSSSFQLRYKLKTRQQDFKISKTATELYYFTNQSLRFQYDLQLGTHLLLRTNASAVYNYSPDGDGEIGYMLSQNIRWNRNLKQGKGKQKLALMVAYFCTDSYQSRVYSSEPSLLYTMGMKSYYGHGISLTALLSTPVTHRLSVTGKFSTLRYWNQETIGTGLEMIMAPHKEDLQLQLRWKL